MRKIIFLTIVPFLLAASNKVIDRQPVITLDYNTGMYQVQTFGHKTHIRTYGSNTETKDFVYNTLTDSIHHHSEYITNYDDPTKTMVMDITSYSEKGVSSITVHMINSKKTFK